MPGLDLPQTELDDVPPGTLSPTLPPLPPQPGPVLPSFDGSSPRVAPEQTDMALVQPVSADQDDDPDQMARFAAMLVSIAALLWLATCLLVLWRRRAVNGSPDLSQD
ncbi:hypothetical protein [Actinomadura sp. SCN-SB]|uniref:hypothetical protein n=1 Tax=Actinomadura sp. SCN-SB TaxID=3373092 RepID=UPI00375352ED